MKTVLVASDLAPRSDMAFRRVAIQAERAEATIHLLHVIEAPDPAGESKAADPYRRAVEGMMTAMEGGFGTAGYRFVINQDRA